MTTPAVVADALARLTEEEQADIRLLIEEFGEHVDLERMNQLFMANEDSLTDADYRGLLALNLFHTLGKARRNPNLITTHEKEWIFQAMGYLGIDPRKVLRDERFAALKR
jgi:hypothetical protein